MSAPSLRELIPVLQTAIGPVILISGVGLLLLTMTNRLGRTIDRARLIAEDLRRGAGAGTDLDLAQVRILLRRARLLRTAIALSGVSVLLVALLVITLFVAALLRLETPWLVSLLFIASMVSLIGSLVAFVRDVNLSLAAVKLELAEWDRDESRAPRRPEPSTPSPIP